MILDIPLHYHFIPAQEKSTKLMIVLHGRGDSIEGFKFLPSELKLNNMNYLLLDAPTPYFTGRSWYELPPKQLNGILQSRDLLTQTLDTLFTTEFSPGNTFLFGFSQGSLLTYEFGARYDRELAGYLAISGYIFDALTLLNEMKQCVNNGNWFCSHGSMDDVLEYSTSHDQVSYLKARGFDIDFRTYEKTHTIAPEELSDIRSWILSRL